MITNTRFRATTSKRTRLRPGHQMVSVIELRKKAGKLWQWVGNDGHTWSPGFNSRAGAEDYAINGSLIQGGTSGL